MKLNLTSKIIQVGNVHINNNVTKQQMDDLYKFWDHAFEYKFDNDLYLKDYLLEKSIIRKYFTVVDFKQDTNCIYYSPLNKQSLRKIKLLIIKGDELSKILQKIIDNSKFVKSPSIQDMEKILVDELSDSISKDIIKKIMKLR